MSRKDTILIAVIVNAGLLAILFATAVIYDSDYKVLEQTVIQPNLVEGKPVPVPQEVQPNLIAAGSSIDEVDNVLKSYEYSANNSYTITEPSHDVFINEPVLPVQPALEDQEKFTAAPSAPEPRPSSNSQESYVEVTVKKGDVLEKIARANGTTVSAIKKANQLQNERLQIGQVLKVPIKKEPAPALAAVLSPKKSAEVQETAGEAVYYVIKTGDNPWKIARQFNVKFEDILRLNHLDEEKARNLKAGDRIRVK